MSLLSAHLEQISCSCQGIDALRFPPSNIFTNALLSNNDITNLIRDTEAHERALFSVPPPPPLSTPTQTSTRGDADPEPARRRQTVFSVASGEVTAAPPARGGSAHPRRRTAVAAVLGGEMHEQLRADRKGELDVEVLLRGAEKLCGVYELPGARERIAALRSRFRAGTNTVAYYEAKVSDQAEQLAAMNRLWMDGDDDKHPEDDTESWTADDLRREEQEAREMETKKKELQERLRAMDKDLGGLINM
ncbi:hypothetical protein CDD80_7568 [Ophiocordyceps camponoti-rufipedis]|uniref:DASH complex subunit SPC34 n=1 Tax=Ophiocordyceps camponoti-rufipedis TaxID=2004952 RepID=A0A2C5Z7W8_9HYPO|nr:hypothetical protein CDD80_7568 [Ophiocordyceps camponoti-rufipedis]